MAKNDSLLQEFCADPARVLQREGIVLPPSEIPARIDQVEFAKRLRGAVASGAVDLSPFAVGAEDSARKYPDIGHAEITVPPDPIIYISVPDPDPPTDPHPRKPK